MPDAKTIDCYCTGCKKPTPHAFKGMMSGLWRFICTACSRGKLLTEKEARA